VFFESKLFSKVKSQTAGHLMLKILSTSAELKRDSNQDYGQKVRKLFGNPAVYAKTEHLNENTSLQFFS